MLLGHGSLLRGADSLPTALAALGDWCTAQRAGWCQRSFRAVAQTSSLVVLATRVRNLSTPLLRRSCGLLLVCAALCCVVRSSKLSQVSQGDSCQANSATTKCFQEPLNELVLVEATGSLVVPKSLEFKLELGVGQVCQVVLGWGFE